MDLNKIPRSEQGTYKSQDVAQPAGVTVVSMPKAGSAQLQADKVLRMVALPDYTTAISACHYALEVIKRLSKLCAPVAGEAQQLAEALREWHGKGDGITTTIPDELVQALYGYLHAAPQANTETEVDRVCTEQTILMLEDLRTKYDAAHAPGKAS